MVHRHRYLLLWVVSVTRTPEGTYSKEPTDKNKGYQQIFAPDYNPKLHGDGGGSTPGGTADTTEKDKNGNNTSTGGGEEQEVVMIRSLNCQRTW